MAPVNCIQFSYLGITRYVICDLNCKYEKIKILVAKTFGLSKDIAPAMQFSDGTGYLFNKELFEYFLILFPQPEQKFFVRLDCNKILENRRACMERKRLPLKIETNDNKRTHHDMQGDDDEDTAVVATPVHRQNCFLGSLPSGNVANNVEEITTSEPPKKRLLLSKSVKKSTRKIVKTPQPKRAFRM